MAQIKRRIRKDGSASYLFRVSNGYDKNGRQVMVNRTYTPPAGLTGRKLEKEVQRQAQAFEDEVRSGVALDANMKLDDLMDRWFEQYAEKQLKPKTVYDYRRLVPRISAALGQIKVNKIRPAHLMRFYADLEQEGARLDDTYTAKQALLDKLPHGTRGAFAQAAGISEETMRVLYKGGRVSQQTAEKVSSAAGLSLARAFTAHTKTHGKLNGNSALHYHSFLSSVFTKAVQWGIMAENPCKRAERPKSEEIDVQAMEEADVARLLSALEKAPVQFSVITQLALLTGARRGEICALRWSDFDRENGTISINRTLQFIPGQGTVFNAPKTKRSRRCIKVGPDCVALLEDYSRWQKAERLKIGSAWASTVEIDGKPVKNDLMFTRWNGQPIDPKAVTSWFPAFLKENNLPAVHFHSLRHTNASLMIAAHVPVITVSGRLGHARTSTTTDIYAGFIRSSDAAAADALTDVFASIREKQA